MTIEFIEDLGGEKMFAARAFANKMAGEAGVVYKIDPFMFSTVKEPKYAYALAYEEGRLAAVAALGGLERGEPEATLVCRNEYIRPIIDFIIPKLPKGTERFLVINDRRNSEAAEIIKAAGFAYDNTERQLVLNAAKLKPARYDGLETRKAQAGDERLIQEFDRAAWGKEYPVTDEVLHKTIFGIINGERAAKLAADANAETGVCGLFGVTVLPALRGKGVGRAFMGQVAGALAAEGYKRIFLQADADNKAANGLYESLGFEVECELDYYCKR